MSRPLTYRTLRGERHPQFLVKGTELAAASYGPNGRFQIIEYRVWDTGDFPGPDRRYRVRDAHKITDAQIAAGGRAPITGDFASEAQAIAFCDAE